VNVVKEFKKTVQECLNTTGVNPDDSASHLLSLKKIFGRIGSILCYLNAIPLAADVSDPVSDY
jgi:hypothetical protein